MFKILCDFIKYYGKDKKYQICLFLFLSVFVGFLEFIGIGLVYPFLMMIIQPKFVIDKWYYIQLSQFFNIENIATFTIIVGLIAVSIFIFKNLLMILFTYFQNKFIISWKNDINIMIMKYYLNAPYKKLSNSSNSEKIYTNSILTAQVLEIFVLRCFIKITNIIILLLILSLLFIKLSTISIFIIIFVVTSMLITSTIFRKKTQELAPKQLKYSLKNNNQIIENINNLKEIRIFGAENFFLNKFSKIQKKDNDIIFKNSFYANISQYLIEIILVMALILLVIMFIYKNYDSSSKIIATFGLIMVAIIRIAPTLNKIQMSTNHINSSIDLAKKLNEEYEQNQFDKLTIPNKDTTNIEFKKSLYVRNLMFSYNPDEIVIKNINIEIKKGEIIGIIGQSGSGKSTLADILMGLLPPDCGNIIIDDTYINEKNIQNFRKIIGYVPQDMNIIEGTYKNNVAWGLKNKDIDETTVKKVLEQAKLFDFVKSRGGINSVIKGLSQGQKQRLLIARALYRDPEIIIFDEATSALDIETEREITQMLTSLKGKKTIITIAHRLMTLRECNKLIYLQDGAIVDVGTFDELIKKYKNFENLIKISKK